MKKPHGNKGAKRPKISALLLGNKRGGGNKGRINTWMMGLQNINWKGDDVGYRAKHNWVEGKLGKPHYCEHCKRSDLPHRNYHWANVSQKYLRKVNDWMRLCVSCHKKYDSK